MGGTPGGIDGVGLEAYGVDEKGETGREGVGGWVDRSLSRVIGIGDNPKKR